jgi:AI-2 transport protein TqsA
MPRAMAVLFSLLFSVALLLLLGLVLVRALKTFNENASLYRRRVEGLLKHVVRQAASFHEYMYGSSIVVAGAAINMSAAEAMTSESEELSRTAQTMVNNFIKDINVSALILQLLGKAAHVMEDVVYIVLFLVFMLAMPPSEDTDVVSRRVERQIFVYIRGKSAISAFVGVCHASVLWAVGLELWLPFGVLTFVLNFIPTVGGFTAVLLPLPLVALDPQFSGGAGVAAFVIPFCVNVFAKDVLEPTLLGTATSLHPVAVLLAILLFGSVWGITGMVLAIPLTAVLRIYLSSVEHPLPKYLARKLAGTKDANGDAPSSACSSPISRRELV